MNWIHHHRGPLVNTRKAIEKGTLTVGFIGGSVTDGRGLVSWPEPMAGWLTERFPNTQIVIENAAIGSTSSDLAVFRVQRDLIDHGCDLVFIEFAVNDLELPATRRHRAREGLVRQLLRSGSCDVVVAYIFTQEFYEDMMQEVMPPSIAEFEAICEHYRLGSVWMGAYALDEVLRGRMRWEEWLPDNIHPQDRGAYSYAQPVIQFLEKELLVPAQEDGALPVVPPPMDPLNWEQVAAVPFDQVEKTGPWRIRRCTDLVWMDQILYTSAPGSKLTVTFEGQAVVVGFDFGKRSAEVRYAIDGGEAVTTHTDKAGWMQDSGTFLLRIPGEELPPGRHTLTLETVNTSQLFMPGTRCDIALIGVVR